MHVVYKVIFEDRLKNNTPPYYYIGSKTNCTIKDGLLYGNKSKKPYYGSSKYKGYRDFINEHTKIEILVTSEDPKEIIKLEEELQIKENVIHSKEYFNLSYATCNTFAMTGYGTYVGATKGYKPSKKQLEKLSKIFNGKNNPFYGKKHTIEARQKMAKAATGRLVSKEARLKISKRFKNKPKSYEQKQKMAASSRNKVTYKDISNGINFRIERSKFKDKWFYVTPYKANLVCKKILNVNSKKTHPLITKFFSEHEKLTLLFNECKVEYDAEKTLQNMFKKYLEAENYNENN